ncbi:isocitrate lyase/phosphoenolpyruvate mutase family protein, partial [Singulisphaera rosea]
TDGRSAKGVDEAIRRGKDYRDAGADGLYIEGLRSLKELEQVGKALAGTPLATTLMEGGGRMPWASPAAIHEAGFAMIMYPTMLLFQIAHTLARALSTLKAGEPMPANEAIDLDSFEDIVGLASWRDIEEKFGTK